MTTIHEDAPNPQFARSGWVDLSGTWSFRFDDEDIGLQQGWWQGELPEAREIVVPFPPESERSGIGDYGFHPFLWYQRSLPAPPEGSGEGVLVHFGAVDYEATVWMNGVLCGQHRGGSSPFTVELSSSMWTADTDPILTVRVFDDPRDLEQPRGKQSWTEEPEGIFYKRTSGIWQPVWMERVPATYILDYTATFDAAASVVNIRTELSSTVPADAAVTLQANLLCGPTMLRADVTAEGRILDLAIDVSPMAEDLPSLLWSPGSPTLLPLQLDLSTGDSVHSYLGLRTIECDRAGVRINGEPVWLRLVLHQGYWPQSHLAAPSAEAIAREVQLTLALGFNGARTHQKAEDPRYLYEADKQGLLLWGEIGAAFIWSDRAINRLTSEWTEIIRRDRNHPSIIAWTPFNESWGIADVARKAQQQSAVHSVVALTRALDPTRPVIGNDGWEHVATDILTIHDYVWDGEELVSRYGDRKNSDIATTYHVAEKALFATDIPGVDELPTMVTEYGGVSFAPESSASWYGYGKVASAEDFEAKYRELTSALHGCDNLIGVCYTQLTDTEQETNGLLTENREPKIDLVTLNTITRGDHGD